MSGELAPGEKKKKKRLVDVRGRKKDRLEAKYQDPGERAWPTWSPRKFVQQFWNGQLTPEGQTATPRFPALALAELDCRRGEAGSSGVSAAPSWGQTTPCNIWPSPCYSVLVAGNWALAVSGASPPLSLSRGNSSTQMFLSFKLSFFWRGIRGGIVFCYVIQYRPPQFMR